MTDKEVTQQAVGSQGRGRCGKYRRAVHGLSGVFAKYK